MIPVLTVPILNRPDLLRAMLASVDHPVARVYVVDNGSCVGALDWPGDHHVADLGFNLGVAASWNLGIRANIEAPWWLLANVDIIFGAGELAMLEAEMADPTPQIVSLFGFAAFAINAAAIDLVGWFDEGFAPMYYEDTDWARRAELLGLRSSHIGGATVHVHGGEMTVKSDAALAEANMTTRTLNRQRFIAKWGGSVGEEEFRTPWNDGWDVRYWPQPSVARLREQTWRRT